MYNTCEGTKITTSSVTISCLKKSEHKNFIVYNWKFVFSFLKKIHINIEFTVIAPHNRNHILFKHCIPYKNNSRMVHRKWSIPFHYLAKMATVVASSVHSCTLNSQHSTDCFECSIRVLTVHCISSYI